MYIYIMLKQLTDILGALIALFLSLPVLLIVIVAIILVDRQNPIFTQYRIGKSKREFRILKLRTMKREQVTPLGNLLRKTGIDEIPQLLNVLSFQMSLVGPRPLTSSDIKRLGWDTDYYANRWIVKPGLTGLAQLSPSCSGKISWFLDKK